MTRTSLRFATATLALFLGISTPGAWAAQENAKARVPLSEAKIIVELNASAEDVGIQIFLDGEPWKSMKIFNPKGNKIFDVFPTGSVGALGVTELFFESNEPSLAELSLDEFLALFPAGLYSFAGETIEGDKISGKARLTHAIPEGPEIIAPSEGAVTNPANTVITWEPVEDPPGSEIVEYQVIVERHNPLRVFQMNVLAATTSVKVPPEFLEPGTDYNFEVLAIEAGGNQTITEGSFRTQ
jgi:fibronectin type III domain protein